MRGFNRKTKFFFTTEPLSGNAAAKKQNNFYRGDAEYAESS